MTRHANTSATCPRCGRTFPTSAMVRTSSAKRGEGSSYICAECAATNDRYHATNDKIVGADKVNEVYCGIEYESSFSDEYARNAMFEYHFIPTHDSSLNSEGNGARYGWYDGNSCEYVSALMKGLNRASKFALTCDRLIAEGHLKVNESCGTHFHVSIDSMKDARGRKVYMSYIRRFCNSLFVPLTRELEHDPETCRKVFGRTLNSWARPITESTRFESHDDRYHFINCLADNNIEFRLNRFTSGKQYQNLMKMEVEMVKCIVKNFCEPFQNAPTDTRRYPNKTALRRHNAKKTAEKLVKIYRKYSANI